MDHETNTKRIETVLSQHPDLKDVVVVERHTDHHNDDAERIAYVVPKRAAQSRDLKFSLFYFADAAPGADDCKYKLYLEGAKFADEHGFEAIWTPERHFHENGGLYPNPSVLSAALATITKQIKLRAGSVAYHCIIRCELLRNGLWLTTYLEAGWASRSLQDGYQTILR